MHLYLHIPFCRQACHYCDFHFSTNLNRKSEMVNTLCHEIALQAHYLENKTLETIYFGGGTPSLLDKREFEQIFNQINQYFKIDSKAEITVEANPDDLTRNKLKDFKELGVNRLSIGIQSFDAQHLQFLNRIHTAHEAENAVKMSQEIGIENITIDLIYGIPAENHAIWEADLAKALALKIPHISSYCLTIEPQTVFWKWLKINKIAPINDDFVASQFKILRETLANSNFEQYEISNFCQPNQYSKHNSSYWKGEEYLGIGPSAHSYNGQSRQYNVSNNVKYIRSISENTIPAEVELLSDFDKVNDYVLTRLRTKWGCDINEIRKIVGEKWEIENQTILTKYLNDDFLSLDNINLLRLTEKGKLFADKIASDLFLLNPE